MNTKRLLSRSNNIAGGLVSRGVILSGWPWSDIDQIPTDIVDAVEGRITNHALDQKYANAKCYELKNMHVSLSGEILGDWEEVERKPPKYI